MKDMPRSHGSIARWRRFLLAAGLGLRHVAPMQLSRFWMPLLVALVVLTATPARAYEDQATLSLDAGMGFALSNDAPTIGITGGIGGTLGIGDAWMLGARLGYSGHPGSPALHVGTAGVEAIYLVDILEWVPFFGLGTDVVFAHHGQGSANWALHAIAGLDWSFSREWLVGVDARIYVLPLSLDEAGIEPAYLQVGLRISKVIDL